MKLQAGLAAFCAVLCGAPVASSQPAQPERIIIQYVEPTDPAHKALYEVAKDKQVLERVRELLVTVRWPRTLQLVFKGCDGESNAFYENAVALSVTSTWTTFGTQPTRRGDCQPLRGRMRSLVRCWTCSCTKQAM